MKNGLQAFVEYADGKMTGRIAYREWAAYDTLNPNRWVEFFDMRYPSLYALERDVKQFYTRVQIVLISYDEALKS
jgi:hypothetical protein